MIFNLGKKKFNDFARFDKEYAFNFVHSITLFWEPPPKKTRLETKNVPPIPPHFLQRWWCKWWLYNVHIMRRNQVLSQPWEVVCWILHGKECLRQPNNIYYTLYIIYKIYISLKKKLEEARTDDESTDAKHVHWTRTWGSI